MAVLIKRNGKWKTFYNRKWMLPEEYEREKFLQELWEGRYEFCKDLIENVESGEVGDG